MTNRTAKICTKSVNTWCQILQQQEKKSLKTSTPENLTYICFLKAEPCDTVTLSLTYCSKCCYYQLIVPCVEVMLLIFYPRFCVKYYLCTCRLNHLDLEKRWLFCQNYMPYAWCRRWYFLWKHIHLKVWNSLQTVKWNILQKSNKRHVSASPFCTGCILLSFFTITLKKSEDFSVKTIYKMLFFSNQESKNVFEELQY